MNATCSIEGCVKPQAIKGMCRSHYKRAWNRIRDGWPKPRATPEDRFWSHVGKDGPVHPTLGTPCWTWDSATTDYGYGLINIDKATVRAHRFSYALHTGVEPDGLFVMHLCDNPPCTNPEHLRLGTNDDNMRDMGDKKRSKFHKTTFDGEAHGNAVLTDDDVREMRRLRREEDLPYHQIGKRFGLGVSHAYSVVVGKAWDHVEGAVPGGQGTRKKFTDADIAEMSAMKAGGAKLREIADRFGASIPYVCSLTTGWAHRNGSRLPPK